MERRQFTYLLCRENLLQYFYGERILYRGPMEKMPSTLISIKCRSSFYTAHHSEDYCFFYQTIALVQKFVTHRNIGATLLLTDHISDRFSRLLYDDRHNLRFFSGFLQIEDLLHVFYGEKTIYGSPMERRLSTGLLWREELLQGSYEENTFYRSSALIFIKCKSGVYIPHHLEDYSFGDQTFALVQKIVMRLNIDASPIILSKTPL